jgi:hypothetical protein
MKCPSRKGHRGQSARYVGQMVDSDVRRRSADIRLVVGDLGSGRTTAAPGLPTVLARDVLRPSPLPSHLVTPEPLGDDERGVTLTTEGRAAPVLDRVLAALDHRKDHV